MFSFLLLIVILGGLFAYVGNWGFPSKEALNAELQKDFDATAQYGGVRGNPIRGFDLQALSLDSARGFKLAADQAQIKVGWRAIFSKSPHPKELALSNGSLTIKRTNDRVFQVSLPSGSQADFAVHIFNFTYNYEDETAPTPFPLTGNLNGAIAFKGDTLHFDGFTITALGASVGVAGDYNRSSDDYDFQVTCSGLSIEIFRKLMVQYYGDFTDFDIDAGVDFTAKAVRQ
ncbi:MAG: hypothetical protein ACREJQ_05625, partial [bacterium]